MYAFWAGTLTFLFCSDTTENSVLSVLGVCYYPLHSVSLCAVVAYHAKTYFSQIFRLLLLWKTPAFYVGDGALSAELAANHLQDHVQQEVEVPEDHIYQQDDPERLPSYEINISATSTVATVAVLAENVHLNAYPRAEVEPITLSSDGQ